MLGPYLVSNPSSEQLKMSVLKISSIILDPFLIESLYNKMFSLCSTVNESMYISFLKVIDMSLVMPASFEDRNTHPRTSTQVC